MAVLVLAAVIDHDFHQSDAHREDIEYVDGLMTLFRQAGDAIGREARGAQSTKRLLHSSVISWSVRH